MVTFFYGRLFRKKKFDVLNVFFMAMLYGFSLLKLLCCVTLWVLLPFALE